MSFNPDIHHRRSARLPEHDYSRPGGYSITIVTRNRECLFGDVVNGEMELNDAGQIVHDEWQRTEELRPGITLDEFIVMPNHVHGIIFIIDDHSVGAHRGAPSSLYRPASQHPGTPAYRRPKSIATLVSGFKSAATKRINQHRQTYRTPVWQRNYWEHIIRNEYDLENIRQYIINNPLQWALDEENPDRMIEEI